MLIGKVARTVIIARCLPIVFVFRTPGQLTDDPPEKAPFYLVLAVDGRHGQPSGRSSGWGWRHLISCTAVYTSAVVSCGH